MSKQSVSEFFKNVFTRNSTSQVSADKKRKCHGCDTLLEPEDMGPRLLERCPSCRGIWLSQAQLSEILDQVSHKAEANFATVESDGHASIGHTFAPSRVARDCPQCAKEMENYKYADTGVWIDACSASHGIWLDEGELRLLAQRSEKNDTDVSDHGTVMDAVSDLILGTL